MVTMMDEDGLSLRYTVKQRAFESKLCRFREVLKREKAKAGIMELETKLFLHLRRTNDPEEYWSYLKAKREFDESPARELNERLTWRTGRAEKLEKFCHQEEQRGQVPGQGATHIWK